MSELIKALGSFFSRDLLYIGAGSLVVMSFILGMEGNKLPVLPEYAIVTIAFISYILGYFCQELFAVLKLVSVRDVSLPGRAFNFFNTMIALEDISTLAGYSMDDLNSLKHYFWSHKKELDDRFSSQVERFLTLRQIATSFGPSLIVSPIVYVLTIWSWSKIWPAFLVVSVFSVFVGVFLCAQSHYRSTQVAIALSKEEEGWF